MNLSRQPQFLLFLVATGMLGFLLSCDKPNLPTRPARQLSLAATVDIQGVSYPVEFTWKEINFTVWDEGNGRHTDWKSSQRAFVRILDANYAIAAWLPGVNDSDLINFHPTFALIDRRQPQYLRTYPDLFVDQSRDGVFKLTALKIERSDQPIPNKEMTREDLSLKREITARKFGYLYGMRFNKEQWRQSGELERLLSSLKGIALLGTRGEGTQKEPAEWKAFSTFNSGLAMQQNMDRHLFGFEYLGDSWAPLQYQGVYWYREGLADPSSPVWMTYQRTRIDQRQNQMVFDAFAQQLIVVWRYPLDPLDQR